MTENNEAPNEELEPQPDPLAGVNLQDALSPPDTTDDENDFLDFPQEETPKADLPAENAEEAELGYGTPIPFEAAFTDPSLQVKYTPEQALEKARKTDLALGERSPGLSALQDLYVSGDPQRVDHLRESMAHNKDLELLREKNEWISQIISKKGKINPLEMDLIMGMDSDQVRNFSTNPKTIIESEYGKKVIDAFYLKEGSRLYSPLNKMVNRDPDKAMELNDKAVSYIAKKEIVESLVHKVNEQIKQTGWISGGGNDRLLGTVGDWAEVLLPLLSQWRLRNRFEGADPSGAMIGTNLRSQVDFAFGLTDEEFERRLTQTVDALAKQNPIMAMEYLRAFGDYSSSDQFVDNLFGLLDIVTAPGMGLAWRAGRKGVDKVADLAKSKVITTPSRTTVISGSPEAVASGKKLEVNIPSVISKVTPEVTETKAVADFVKGHNPTTLDIGRALNAAGDTHAAAGAHLAKVVSQPTTNIAEETVSLGQLINRAGGNVENTRNVLPSAINPEANSPLRTNVMDTPLAPLQNADAMEYHWIQRLNPEGWEAAVAKTIDILRERITNTSGVLDIRLPDLPAFAVTTPRQSPDNIGSVVHRVGDPYGQLFDSFQQAENTARRWYGLSNMDGVSPSVFSIKQHGNGFYIEVTRHVDETLDPVRKAIPQGDNTRPTEWWDGSRVAQRVFGNRMFLNPWLKLGARKADHSSQALNAIFDDERKILGKLNRKEQKQFGQFLEDQRHKPNANGGFGHEYTDVNAFELDWTAKFQSPPNQKLIDAYFDGFISGMRKEWLMENSHRLRDRARKGIQELSFIDIRHLRSDSGEPFNIHTSGRFLEDLPSETNIGDAGILVMRSDGTHEIKRYTRLSPQDKNELKHLQTNEGYRLYQIENPQFLPFKDIVGEENISYVYSKQGVEAPITHGGIDWNPGGGHIIYTDPFAVAQGKVSRIVDPDGTVRHTYRGDRVVLAASTKAEMARYEQAMETARQLMLSGNDTALNNHLAQTLPWNITRWKAFFEETVTPNGQIVPPLWDKSVPFVGRDYGSLTITQKPSAYKGFDNLENVLDSKHSLVTDVENRFATKRDPQVWRIKEEGIQGQPNFRVSEGYANTMDPIVAFEKGIQAAVKSGHFKEVQLAGQESFAANFLHLMKPEVQNQFFTNPLKFIQSSDIWEVTNINKKLLGQAEATRRALANLLSQHAPEDISQGLYRQKVADWVFENYGQKKADYVSNYKLATTLDPRVFMPTIAYHAKIGLGAVSQLFTQSAALVNLMAIGGRDAINNVGTIALTRWVLHNPNMLDHIAQMAPKVSKFSADDFKESFGLMDKLGFAKVEGDHTWVHEMFSSTNRFSTWGKVKELSQFFFKEGEKATRILAFNTAFSEFKRANPGVIVDAAAAEKILDRAGTLAGNMTKHANASWQRGWTNIPTQFWSVQGRLAELVFGRELSGIEKTRLVLSNMAFFGVPAGTLGVSFGIYPWAETIKKWAIENDLDTESPFIKAFLDGIPSMMLQMLAGRDYDITGKFGPQGIDAIREVWEGKFLEVIGGVSGALTSDILKSVHPVMHYVVTNLASIGDDAKETMPAPSLQDYLDAFRNISSVNNFTKMYMAMNLEKMISKNEVFIGKADTVDGIMAGIFGLQNRTFSDIQIMNRSLKYKKDAQQEAETQIQKYYRRAMEAYAKEDRELGDKNLRAARVYFRLADFQQKDLGRILGEARKGWQSFESRVRHDFFYNKAPASKAKQRMERYIELQKREQR